MHYVRQVNYDPGSRDMQDDPRLIIDSSFSDSPNWPKVIGIVQIVSGFITGLLGALEVFVTPLIGGGASAYISLNKQNCFGTGIYAGLLMVITGCTAVRSTISRRMTTVYRFFNLTLLTLLLYSGLTVFLIVAYSLGWTDINKFPNEGTHTVHLFLTISMVLGLMFSVASFMKYADNIFFGRLQLARRWAQCCLPCIFPAPPGQLEENSLDSDDSDSDDPA